MLTLNFIGWVCLGFAIISFYAFVWVITQEIAPDATGRLQGMAASGSRKELVGLDKETLKALAEVLTALKDLGPKALLFLSALLFAFLAGYAVAEGEKLRILSEQTSAP